MAAQRGHTLASRMILFTEIKSYNNNNNNNNNIYLKSNIQSI